VSSRQANDHAAAFENLYSLLYRDIASYVSRRVPRDEADDVVAKVFTVAWRRYERVPQPPEDRLWLFGVARRCVADNHRSGVRQLRLNTRLWNEGNVTNSSVVTDSDSRYDLATAAMAQLKSLDREALQLVLWDGLTHLEAATVMGCSVNAFELRYRRARNAVRLAVEGSGAARELADNAFAPMNIQPAPEGTQQ
jgi:RNA polymerase sigma factor (sigma-70 family)